MNRFKYLSDELSITLKAPNDLIGSNIKYTVKTDDNDVIYTGSIYATGNNQTIYLNDIIETYIDDYSWFKHASTGTINSRVIHNFFVEFEGIAATYTISNVINARRVPNSKVDEIPDMNATDVVYSVSDLGTGVLPRIPKNISAGSGFFMMNSLYYPQHVVENNSVLTWYVRDKRDSSFLGSILECSATNANYVKHIIDSNDLSYIADLVDPNIDILDQLDIVVLGDMFPMSEYRVVCNIDKCPAEYYVSWINRYGTWQCQPLYSKWEMTENVATSSIVTITNETVPVSKTSEFRWKLNTNWLTYAEHDEFESLLTSKYVYLFNTKTQEGHYVNVENSDWTFRNSINTRKPFNLTLNLVKSQKYIATY